MVGGLRDTITCAKFQIEIFIGYDFTGGRIFDFPIDFSMGLTTVQRYCAACDVPFSTCHVNTISMLLSLLSFALFDRQNSNFDIDDKKCLSPCQFSVYSHYKMYILPCNCLLNSRPLHQVWSIISVKNNPNFASSANTCNVSVIIL